MWNSQNTFDADVTFAVRLVLTGNATVEQAAAVCGMSLSQLQALLDAIPQTRLQEMQRTRR